MNYFDKMHVGDVVISAIGSIGYVCAINYKNNFFEWTLLRNNTGAVPPFAITYHVPQEEIPHKITQIGVMKIEPLAC